MSPKLFFAVLLLLVAVAFPARAEIELERFEQAIADHQKAVEVLDSNPALASMLFHQAITEQQQLLGSNPDLGWLHYNIAIAHLHMGRNAQAIASLRKAQRLLGHQPQITANLASARRAPYTPPGSPPIPMPDLPVWVLFAVATASWTASWIMLALCRGRGIVALVAVIVMVTTAATTALASIPSSTEYAGELVLRDDVVAYTGPGERAYQAVYNKPLPGATEHAIIERRGGWILIRNTDGKSVWIPRESAIVIWEE
ncbi:MAG: tetratricopeptide repeat protein [Planctomycetota bacterium]